MRRLIFQVSVGKPSELYKFCQESVESYCSRHNIDYYVLTEPQLKILPDPKTTNRSQGAIRLGYLPIYEKEYAFSFFDRYEQIAIVDSDIYIRDNAPNIFDSFDIHCEFGGVIERDMPVTPEYANKIYHYSRAQYSQLETDHKPNNRGWEFFNMGLMVMNKSISKDFENETPKEFISRKEFKRFVDGEGPWKWSTDQTLLNYWVRSRNFGLDRMNWKWNALYKGITDEKFNQAYFLHFFLKDKLPNKGEDINMLKEIVKGNLSLDFKHL